MTEQDEAVRLSTDEEAERWHDTACYHCGEDISIRCDYAAPALDVERLRQALRNVNFTDASAWAAAIRDEYARLSPEPEDA